MNDVEVTRPYVSALWDVRLDTVVDADDGVLRFCDSLFTAAAPAAPRR